MIALGLSVAAGLLTALSPCVLPALPIVVGSAAAQSRYGPLALAAGLVTAFTIAGVGITAAGPAIGLEIDTVRLASGVLLVAAGALLVVPGATDRIGAWLSPIASGANRLAGRAGGGLAGQFAIGALLGAVWSPCVGPALGAALGLAASGDSLGRATLLMIGFGAGSAAPLLAIAYGSRRLIAGTRRLAAPAAWGKPVFGAALVLMGALVVSGADKAIEAAVLARLPQWWVELLASV